MSNTELKSEIRRDVIEGNRSVVTTAEFRRLPKWHKQVVDLVIEDTPNGIKAMKPTTDDYDASAPIRLVKVGYVELDVKEESEKLVYTRSELISELKRIQGIVGRTPTVTDIEKHGEISMSPYYRVFGSIDDALSAADLYPGDDDRED